MNAYLNKLIRERAELGQAAKTLYDQAAEKGRDLEAAEQTNITGWQQRCTVLDTEIKRLTEAGESAVAFAELADKAAGLQRRRADLPGQAGLTTTAAGGVDTRSRQAKQAPGAGERFTTSKEFTAYSGRGSSEAVVFEDFLTRAAIATGDFDEYWTMKWAGPPAPALTTPLLDVVGRITTSFGSVEYLYWNTGDPLAQKVPEGTLKPEADIVHKPVKLGLDTFAHYKGITRQTLEDIPQIRSIVDTKLRRGVLRALDVACTEVINANEDVPDLGEAEAIAGIRLAQATVQSAGYEPNAFLMNPLDLAHADLDAMMTTLRGPRRTDDYWNLRPVPVPGLARGTVLVGDFATGVSWFDRNQVEILMSDSHADLFIKNTIVILAETRAAFAVTEPASLARFTIAPDGGEEPPPGTVARRVTKKV